MKIDSNAILLKDLFNEIDFEVRAYNICFYLGLKTVFDLGMYIEKNDSFLNIRNCGKKTNIELLDISKRYFKKDPKIEYDTQMVSDEQFEFLLESNYENLSVRARNAILKYFDNNILSKIIIKDYFIDKKFAPQKLQNVGRLTIPELQEFSNKIIILYFKNLNYNKSQVLPENSGNESKVDFLKIDSLIKEDYENLSKNARMVIFKCFGEYVPNRNLIKKHFINNKFVPSKIKNIDFKTVFELLEFKERTINLCKQNLNLALTSTEATLFKFKVNFGININQGKYLSCFLKNELPIITFAAEHIEQLLNLKPLEALIFKNYYNLLPEILTLQELTKDCGLTYERIRRKEKIVLKKSKYKLQALKGLLDNSSYSDLLKNDTLINIESEINSSEIDREVKVYGIKFSLLILEILFSGSYFVLNQNDEIKKPSQITKIENYKAFKRLKGAYLVKKEIISKLELIKVYEYILQSISKIQSQNLYLNISEKLSTEKSVQMESFLAKFINYEFNLSFNNYIVTIPKNNQWQRFEIAQKALEQIDRMASIKEVMDSINILFPYGSYNQDSIRNVISSYKDLFIIERKQISLYGLKQWENVKTGVKGGTMADLATEFILSQNKPVKFSKVVEYISQYRESNANSILNTLKTGNALKRFKFYKGGKIGLKDEYQKDQLLGLEEISLDELLDSLLNED